MGLVSEAGMPAIADPGSSVVRAAHDLGVQVVPLTGPMSLMLALASSGLNGQNFAFVGYLPQDASERTQRIRELESLALKTGQTQIFIETPYRNTALLGALLFAFFDALQLRLQQSGAAVLPYQMYLMLPYVLSIVALVLVARRASYPQALMKPYRKGER